MALHPNFPESPHEIVDPQTLRDTDYGKLLCLHNSLRRSPNTKSDVGISEVIFLGIERSIL